MNILDIPTYFNKDTIKIIKDVNRKSHYGISQVYGSLTGRFSARENIRLNSVTEDQMRIHLKDLEKEKVDFYYALNSSCFGSLDVKRMLSLRAEIDHLKNLGVKNFIIAYPFLIDVIKEAIPESKIKLSVILEIDDIKRIRYFYDKVEVINISTTMNRNFKFLEYIEEYRDKIEILCNEVCLYKCPFRASHYTIESHRDGTHGTIISDYPVDKCYEMMTDVELLMSRFVLPEWIQLYLDYATYFKISGRTFPQKFIEFVTRHYAEGKSPENILKLFPIVVGSIKAEQSNEIEERILEMPDEAKKSFIKEFSYIGDYCRYKCPCSHCGKYVKYFKKIGD